MKFKDFEINAIPIIQDSYCECGTALEQVSNGLFGSAQFCPNCENIYQLKRVKVPKSGISEEYLKQCREEVKR